jgi:thioredoxin reductase (NADPH)
VDRDIGFFFRDQRVFVIGGGDTAMEESASLTQFAKPVTIIHRPEENRASKIILEWAQKIEKIDFLLNAVVDAKIGVHVNGTKRLTHL